MQDNLDHLLQFLIKKGKKELVESIIKDSLSNLVKKNKKTNLKKFINQSFKNVEPNLNVVVRKRKHRNFYIPEKLSERKRIFYVNHWLSKGAFTGNKQSLYQNLGFEFELAESNKGYAVKKKNELINLAISVRKKTFMPRKRNRNYIKKTKNFL